MRTLDYSPLQTRKPKHPPSSFAHFNGEKTQILLTNSPKMAKKSFLKPTLATILLIIFSFYAFSNTLIFSPTINSSDSTFPSTTTRSLQTLNSSPSPPIKLYLYDLPRKFTYGVIENYLIARHDTDLKNLKYPGNQHSAEWFLFSDLIHGTKSEAIVRVLDPEEADLFYVPFFSSLSLVVNPPVKPGEEGVERVYSDEEMQESLVEWLEGGKYWKRNNGWDHVFICQDPNALYKIVDRVRNGVLLVSDFGRLRRDQASLVKDVILPYSHRINPFNGDVGVDARKSLLFFMGNRYRKEGGKVRDLLFQVLENEEDVIIKHGTQSRESRRMATQGMHSSKFCLHPAGDTPSACRLFDAIGGKVRDLLFQVLENEEDVIIKHGTQSRESRRMATQGMHSSKFCLHPAGDTPSACRLFDAIVSLCIPVIVSDFVEMPFEDVINYNKIAVFIDSNTAVKPGYLIKKLRKVSTKRILQYQQELSQVKHYFEYDDPNGTVKEIWRQVSTKVSHIKLMINREKRIVKRELLEPDCSCLCSNKTGPSSTF